MTPTPIILVPAKHTHTHILSLTYTHTHACCEGAYESGQKKATRQKKNKNQFIDSYLERAQEPSNGNYKLEHILMPNNVHTY